MASNCYLFFNAAALFCEQGEVIINNFLAALNFPTVTPVTFKRREREVGSFFEAVKWNLQSSPKWGETKVLMHYNLLNLMYALNILNPYRICFENAFVIVDHKMQMIMPCPLMLDGKQEEVGWTMQVCRVIVFFNVSLCVCSNTSLFPLGVFCEKMSRRLKGHSIYLLLILWSNTYKY